MIWNKKLRAYISIGIASLISIILIYPLAQESWKTWAITSKFEQIAPKPEWWADVNISEVNITNYDNLLEYWASEPRCCSREEIGQSNRKFFKAAYILILKNLNDSDLVLNTISLMNLGYLDYPNLLELQELGVEKYFYHDQPLHNCVNCKEADHIAYMIYRMGSLYWEHGTPEKEIALSYKFLTERNKEISNGRKLDLYFIIARSYEKLNQWQQAIDVLNTGITEFTNSANKREMDLMARTLRMPKRLLKEYEYIISSKSNKNNIANEAANKTVKQTD